MHKERQQRDKGDITIGSKKSRGSLEVGLAQRLLGGQVYPAYVGENGGYHVYPDTSSVREA
jgi:hypothetical protein